MRDRRSKAFLRLVYAAMCLSLCFSLPFLTGGNSELGNALCLMHLPVFLCGLVCGPTYGMLVGMAAPLLRSLILGMPSPLFPRAVGMATELGVYGLVCGLLFFLLPKKSPYLYLSLGTAMILGRLAGGGFKLVLLGLGQLPTYSFSLFLSGYFIESIPGILLQMLLIPLVYYALRRAKALP